MTRKLLYKWKYKVGYEVRYEEISGEEAGGGKSFVMRTAYTPEGLYIGDPKWARILYVKKRIKPELSRPSSNVCSIGFCENTQLWYGWSHRAMCGFGVGNKLFEEDYSEATDETPYVEHGVTFITNLDEAKQAAINFADSVS